MFDKFNVMLKRRANFFSYLIASYMAVFVVVGVFKVRGQSYII